MRRVRYWRIVEGARPMRRAASLLEGPSQIASKTSTSRAVKSSPLRNNKRPPSTGRAGNRSAGRLSLSCLDPESRSVSFTVRLFPLCRSRRTAIRRFLIDSLHHHRSVPKDEKPGAVQSESGAEIAGGAAYRGGADAEAQRGVGAAEAGPEQLGELGFPRRDQRARGRQIAAIEQQLHREMRRQVSIRAGPSHRLPSASRSVARLASNSCEEPPSNRGQNRNYVLNQSRHGRLSRRAAQNIRRQDASQRGCGRVP